MPEVGFGETDVRTYDFMTKCIKRDFRNFLNRERYNRKKNTVSIKGVGNYNVNCITPIEIELNDIKKKYERLLIVTGYREVPIFNRVNCNRLIPTPSLAKVDNSSSGSFEATRLVPSRRDAGFGDNDVRMYKPKTTDFNQNKK